MKPTRRIAFETSEASWASLSLSPDGRTIAFDILGDLYVMPVSGGRAEPIARGMAFETQPVFSPDGKWLVGSYKDKTKPSEYVYTFFRRADGAVVHSPVVPTKVGGGDLRLDPAPRWNRTSDQVLVPGMAKDGTVQLYILTLKGLR